MILAITCVSFCLGCEKHCLCCNYMEAIVYENISDASLRLERLKLALLAFVGIRATAPAVTVLLLPVDLLPASSSAPGALSKGSAGVATEAQVRQVCADRAQLLNWLQHAMNLAMDMWVAVAVEPRDAAEVSLLASWQCDRHRSPLRQADVVCLSLRQIALLWGDVQRPAPALSRFLLSHQSLFLDVTGCLGEGDCRLLDPALLTLLQVKDVANWRTCAVAFYNTWLPLISRPRGLMQLQQQLRAVARHVLSPLRLPFCCSYGGDVETLQHNLVTVPFSCTDVVGVEGKEKGLFSTVSASLLATRSLRDTCSLVALLFGNPLVDYYNEAMAYCASVQRRRRSAGLVYAASPVPVKPVAAKTARRVSMAPLLCEKARKRARKGGVVVTAASAPQDGADETERPLWCEDIGG